MKQSQPEPQKFYHIVKDGRLVQGMFARKGNATKTARTIPGATIVVTAGRAELRKMGIEVDGQGYTPTPGENLVIDWLIQRLEAGR